MYFLVNISVFVRHKMLENPDFYIILQAALSSFSSSRFSASLSDSEVPVSEFEEVSDSEVPEEGELPPREKVFFVGFSGSFFRFLFLSDFLSFPSGFLSFSESGTKSRLISSTFLNGLGGRSSFLDFNFALNSRFDSFTGIPSQSSRIKLKSTSALIPMFKTK